MPPKEHADEFVKRFKNAWENLDISYDHFIRTTDEDHKDKVTKKWENTLICY